MKNWLIGLIKEGRYTLGGVQNTIPIYRTDLTGDIITIYLYFDETISGKFTNFELIDQDGEVFDDQPDNIEKPNINGLLVSFKYTLKRI